MSAITRGYILLLHVSIPGNLWNLSEHHFFGFCRKDLGSHPMASIPSEITRNLRPCFFTSKFLQYWDLGEKKNHHVFRHAFLTSNQPQIPTARNPSYETWRFKSNPKFPKPEHVRTEAFGRPEVDCASDTKKKCLWHYIVYIHNTYIIHVDVDV